MKKEEFLKMMVQDNETESEPQKSINASIIDCIEIALNQAPDIFEVPTNKNLKDIYSLLESQAKKNKKGDIGCVRPFEAAEIICGYLGIQYLQTQKPKAPAVKVNLEDFL